MATPHGPTQPEQPLRIVSLIPSATEIVGVLGLTDCLVGRSHECDYPEAVRHLPVCTAPKFHPEGTSRDIHDRVTDLLQSALSVYKVDTALLAQLAPTHILTQAQCEVCAVSLKDVEAAVAQLTPHSPQIISLQPNTLSEVWADIQRVGAALFGTVDAALVQSALQTLRTRLDTCTEKVNGLMSGDRPTVACIEWPDPLMAAGNWIPELVELAGGKLPDGNTFGQVGQHSPWLEWETLSSAQPEVIIFMPCGYDLQTTRQEVQPLLQHPNWPALNAVQTRRVYVTDGNQYFNRPGPRLVDSLEILAEILHPQQITFGHLGQGWQPL